MASAVGSSSGPTRFTYAELDHPKNAVHILCRDVARMARFSFGSMGAFKHRKRPTVFVHIVGRVVGINVKEKVAFWLVDDGSAVINVQHHRNTQPLITPPPIRLARPEKLGVASQYIRPPSPPPPPSKPTPREVALEHGAEAREFEAAMRPVRLNSLVSVVGRASVVSFRGREEERRLEVDRVVPPGRSKDEAAVRTARQGYLEILQDVNEEARHLLHVLQLADSEYTRECTTVVEQSAAPVERPLIINGQVIKPATMVKAPVKAEVEEQSEFACRLVDGRPVLVSKLNMNAPAPSTSSRSPPRRVQTLQRMVVLTPAMMAELRKQRDAELAQASTSTTSSQSMPWQIPNFARGSYAGADRKPPAIVPEIKSSPTRAFPTPEPPPRPRQLRDYRKLPDSQMTEDLLRIYVQKHITDYCRRLSHDAHQPSSKRPRLHMQLDAAAADQPPAFTLAYLQRVTKLRKFAHRVVEVILSKRAKRSSSEAVESKAKRLWESVICNIVADGMIVLADSRLPPKAPFDGRRPAQPVYDSVDPQHVLDWDGVESIPDEVKQDPAASGDASFLRYRSGASLTSAQPEAYQLVTPALLARPVSSVLGLPTSSTATDGSDAQRRTGRLGTSAHATIVGHRRTEEASQSTLSTAELDVALRAPAERVTQRLRALDDRWRSIRSDSVAEAMAYVRSMHCR